ncbi:thioredoxin domain-containing protein [Pantoea agglomerans]|uniref:thioredoxin domain-containing protein n=1 Tax=Enterobacter agglomerans TaxID=549 RepID=UPI001F20E425|nr:thioredoxin domain-containing protein [Pantoea agglomerans]
MSKKLQARQQTYLQSALKTHRLLMQLDGVPVKAPGDSKVIVTEFFNYDCITCSMMAPVMENVMTANAGVRFAFRDWTIFAARYPESAQASRRDLSIYRKQGANAYIAFHNGIYRTGHNEGKLTAEDIEKTAAATGADLASDDDNAVSGHITENNAVLAEMLGLTGTPGIIVMPAENATADNTTVIPGMVSGEEMQQAIARAGKG